MRRVLPLLLSLPLFCATLHAQGKSAPERPSAARRHDYREIGDDLKRMTSDQSATATVADLTLRRDAASFTLASGTLRLCTPVAGRACAAVFVGSGRYTFTPSTQVEREHLARFYKKESMEGTFTTLFLLFADSTAQELRRSLTFGPGGASQEFDNAVRKAIGFVYDEQCACYDDEFARAFLNGEGNDLFYAHIGESGATKFFEINPYEYEEVRFMREGQLRASTFREVVSRFPRRGVDDVAAAAEVKDRIAIDRYLIDATIADDLESSFATELRYHRLKGGGEWTDFYLFPNLRVDSMVWGDGTRARFHQTGGGTLWVNDSAGTGENRTLRMYYRGKIFARERDWILLMSSISWYPFHGERSYPLFDMTFHTPRGMQFASVGKNVSTVAEGDVVTSRWVLERPTRNASFNIGIFSEQRFTPDSIAPVTVLRGGGSSAGMGEQVGWDVEHSIKFYEFLYGKLPLDHFYATEIPAMHGEAFPGLIHLSAITFDQNDESGYQEIFRAHEVAHQWWGLGVGFRTYHDQWLSEAFSEYSGLMYMQAVLKNNEKFFKRLNEYKRSILDNRKSLFVESPQAGPIWLGQRTRSSSTLGDYDLIVYKKGAWVLHMLRNLMLDLNTMNEDKYRAAMREFYTTYAGREASTEDFRRVVERAMGMNMEWFFRQWVQGTGAPSYAYAYRVEDAPGGKYRLTLRVDQSNVPEDFQMYVPVKIDFGDGKMARLRVLVRGAHSEQALPLLPLKPKGVVFNDLESVLCDVKEVDWE